ncbi:MAG TPA: YhjD/YihY/BrkB family envelope integrity protein [Oscillospiraceae bacterium]|nr:YhjD/YihY/BrkB family envelope integrity protein [Oscillospiraceae bacterium]HPW00166.1 YhjD/YihY/BrkB family envelope integrity protein [Oscillospiraceae bacterium]
MKRTFVVHSAADAVMMFFDKRVTRCASSLSYYLSLSLFPALICAHWILGMMGQDLIKVLEEFSELIPVDALRQIEDYLLYISKIESPALLTAGLIADLTTGSAAFRQLLDMVREIYGGRRNHTAFYYIVSILSTVLLLAVIYFGALLIVAGNWLLRLLDPYFGLAKYTGFWPVIRFGLLLLFLFLFLYFLYKIASWHSDHHAAILPGAAVASVAVVAVSAVFSWFIGLSVRYSLIYGSLASFIILMIWLYMTSNVIIIGALINNVWRKGPMKIDHDL